jgi:DNA-binding NarL/FixJ family response regulator
MPEPNQDSMTHDPATTQKPASVLIVDDHPLVREGLALQIGRHRDLLVCGQAESVDEAMALVKSSRPDLVIVDLTLKESNGLDLLKQIKAWDDKIRMVVLSAHDGAHYAQRALRAGATGYINKHEMPELIIDAIRKVLAGEVFLGPQAAGLLKRRSAGNGEPMDHSPPLVLSDRELEVFRLIGDGITTRAIAGQLQLSVKTIETHRENIKAKLGLKNGTELGRLAVQWMLENS